MQIDYQCQAITRYHSGRRLQKLMNLMDHLEWSLMINATVDAHAMTSLEAFWYKTFVFAEGGVLKLDTISEFLIAKSSALAIIHASQHKAYPFRKTTLDAVMHNWQRYGAWERRLLGAPLLWEWAGRRRVAPHIIPDPYAPAIIGN